MPNANHRQRLLNRILTTLKRDVRAEEPEARPVLEQFLYAACREGTTRGRADQAYRNLQAQFFDWNEVRVSSVREVAEALDGLPDAEQRAFRIIRILQEVYETTFSFDLESLHKKGLKQAQKQLERFEGASPFAVASTLQIGLSGHALPIDGDMRRTMRRLELIDGDPDDEALQASLEHLVPKAKGPIFCEILNAVAQDYCHERAPKCQACPLHDLCPSGQENLKSGTATRVAARAKSR
jgi:endonuclease-3